MIKYEYMHCSMLGSYWIPCTVLARLDNEVYVEYYDGVLEEKVCKWVGKENVKEVDDVDIS